MTHKGWCVVKHQTNKTNKQKASYEVKGQALMDYAQKPLLYAHDDVSWSVSSSTTTLGVGEKRRLSTQGGVYCLSNGWWAMR